MKKILVLGISSMILSLSADTTVEKQASDGTITLLPSSRNEIFELYAECLIYQPNGSSIYYGAEAIPFDTAIAIPAISPNWEILEISPDYGVGFKVGLAAIFADMNTKLEINWERIHTINSGAFSIPTSGNIVGPISDIGPNSYAYANASGSVNFQFDSADLLFSQQCCVFERLYPSFLTGASFARIKQALSSTYSSSSNTTSRTISMNSLFIGAGPKFGVNFDYRIFKNFFFSGICTGGLIIGNSSNSTTYDSYAPYLSSNNIHEPNSQTTTVPNRTQLIPAAEERLGFSYIGVTDNFAIKLGVGYTGQVFINAIQSMDMTAPQELPALAPGVVAQAGEYAVGFERTLSNFILQGPYISFSAEF